MSSSQTGGKKAFFVLRQQLTLQNCHLRPHTFLNVMPGATLPVPVLAGWNRMGDGGWYPDHITLPTGADYNPKEVFKGGNLADHLLGPFDYAELFYSLWLAQGTMGQVDEEWKMELQRCGMLHRVPLVKSLVEAMPEYGHIVGGRVCLLIDDQDPNGCYGVAPLMQVVAK